MTPVIAYSNVTVRARARLLLDAVTLYVAPGEKVALAGPSGSGKTTLLTTLVGAHVPVCGKVVYEGRAVDPHTVRDVRAAVAYIPQEPLLGADTAREALLLPYGFRAYRHRRPDAVRIEETLALLGLAPDILDRRVDEISGGEKQRVVLARAILLGKRVFLADEPTSALDPESRQRVTEALDTLGATVLSATHDRDWMDWCHRRVGMRDGRIEGEEAADAGH